VLQKRYPEQLSGVTYETAFTQWYNAFSATWPSLIEEPESEKVKVSDVKLKGLIGLAEVFLPELDPENKATFLQWIADTASEDKVMFPHPLELDWKALAEYEPPVPAAGGGPEDKEPSPPNEAK
jgi:hypothetical protein